MAFRIGLVACALLAGCHKEAAAPAAAKPATPRVGLALGEPIDGLGEALRAALRDHGFEVSLESALGRATAQLEQVAQLLDQKVSILVLDPVVPDVLFRAGAAASDRHVPLLGVLRGDGMAGPWVGVGSGTLAREAGERAGAWLATNGRTRPRVVVVEDPRWPESRRRVEGTLRGLESACGEIELPLRASLLATPEKTAATLVVELARLQGADVLVAGDEFSTAAAVQAAGDCVSKDSIVVVGATSDEKLVESARASGSRLLLVAWDRKELVKRVVTAVDALLADPGRGVKEELPSELVGLGGIKAKKAGS